MGYILLYTLVVGIVMLILVILSTLVSSNSSLSNALSNNSGIFNLLVIFIFQAIFIPLIILDVIHKDTKGYIKKNYVTILAFSLIACLLNLIPIAGQFIYLILNAFYPLLIISMWETFESTEHSKIPIQGINNNGLLK